MIGDYCRTRKHVVFDERFKFLSTNQNQGESMDDFLRKCEAALYCMLSELKTPLMQKRYSTNKLYLETKDKVSRLKILKES